MGLGFFCAYGSLVSGTKPLFQRVDGGKWNPKFHFIYHELSITTLKSALFLRTGVFGKKRYKFSATWFLNNTRQKLDWECQHCNISYLKFGSRTRFGGHFWSFSYMKDISKRPIWMTKSDVLRSSKTNFVKMHSFCFVTSRPGSSLCLASLSRYRPCVKLNFSLFFVRNWKPRSYRLDDDCLLVWPNVPNGCWVFVADCSMPYPKDLDRLAFRPQS